MCHSTVHVIFFYRQEVIDFYCNPRFLGHGDRRFPAPAIHKPANVFSSEKVTFSADLSKNHLVITHSFTNRADRVL